jgi:hypothetical protein
LDAIEEMGIAVQRLPLGELARGEFAKKPDVIGWFEGRKHRAHLLCAARRGKFAVVVSQRVVDRAEPSAGRGRVELASVYEIAPEDHRVSVAAVGAGR